MSPVSRRIVFHFAAMVAVFFGAASLPAADLPLAAGSAVHFATRAEGQKIVATRDMYIAAMSPFDREVRLQSEKPVREEEFLAFVSKQVLEFDDAEIAKCTEAVTAAAKKMARWKLHFPATVSLVKTTGDDENHLSHCRGNAVVLPKAVLQYPAEKFEKLVLHELFHILSRNNAGLRDKLYATIGFHPCGAIALPPDLQPQKLTNPDAPVPAHAIEIVYQGRTLQAVPVLYSSLPHYDPRRGGSLFAYLEFKLMAIEEHSNAEEHSNGEEHRGRWTAQIVDGKPLLIDPLQAPAFLEKIGRNTAYIISPEEILADNFQFLASGRRDLPSPKISAAIDEVLRGE